MTKLYLTKRGRIVETDGRRHELPLSWDALLNSEDLPAVLRDSSAWSKEHVDEISEADLLAPIGHQEVWAAGVTYLRSREARMEESKSAGGGDFYDRVYAAARPELFFKGTPHRVAGPGGKVRLRADSKWNVPEPEL